MKIFTPGFKFDMTQFSQGARALRGTSRKSDEDFLSTQARGLGRILLAVTPPGDGKESGDGNISGMSANRKRGEAIIEADVLKLLEPVRTNNRKLLEQAEQVTGRDIYQKIESFRNKRTGRVRRVKKRDRIFVTKAQFRAEVKQRFGDIGILAAGWAPSLRRLGQALPAWIDRHRGRGDGGRVLVRGSKLVIRLTNRTSFIGTVRDLRRRVQFALNLQGKRMMRQAEDYLENKARKAGFDVR